MAINLENPFHKDQFNAFVDFASGRDEDTIVRLDALAKGQGLPGLGGKPRSISVKGGDGYAHFWRGGTSKSVGRLPARI